MSDEHDQMIHRLSRQLVYRETELAYAIKAMKGQSSVFVWERIREIERNKIDHTLVVHPALAEELW